jgi:calpain-7
LIYLAPNNSQAEKLKPKEKEVLIHTSRINGFLYVPWLSSDLNERFSYSSPFNDPDGLLDLANQQKQYFVAWKRPAEICPGRTPQMVSLLRSPIMRFYWISMFLL